MLDVLEILLAPPQKIRWSSFVSLVVSCLTVFIRFSNLAPGLTYPVTIYLSFNFCWSMLAQSLAWLSPMSITLCFFFGYSTIDFLVVFNAVCLFAKVIIIEGTFEVMTVDIVEGCFCSESFLPATTSNHLRWKLFVILKLFLSKVTCWVSLVIRFWTWSHTWMDRCMLVGKWLYNPSIK